MPIYAQAEAAVLRGPFFATLLHLSGIVSDPDDSAPGGARYPKVWFERGYMGTCGLPLMNLVHVQDIISVTQVAVCLCFYGRSSRLTTIFRAQYQVVTAPSASAATLFVGHFSLHLLPLASSAAAPLVLRIFRPHSEY